VALPVAALAPGGVDAEGDGRVAELAGGEARAVADVDGGPADRGGQLEGVGGRVDDVVGGRVGEARRDGVGVQLGLDPDGVAVENPWAVAVMTSVDPTAVLRRPDEPDLGRLPGERAVEL
jgi:hypothetical protein